MKKVPSFLVSLCAALCIFYPLQRASAQVFSATPVVPPGPVIYEGARLIIGDGSAPIENSAFVVEEGRFTRIGKKGEVEAPPGAAHVDLTGKTVMPTMIDSHGHLGPTEQGYIDDLNLLAYCGIGLTTSMGRDLPAVFPIRADQPPNGAQILTSGRGLVGRLGITPETIAAGKAGRLPEDEREIAVQVEYPDEARMHVQELAWERVDFIKIWVDSRLGTEVPMSPDVYKAIINEAHARNLRVYAHSWSLDDAKNLVRAGIDSLAHPIRSGLVDDQFMELLKDRPNVFMQTNLNSTEFLTLTEDPPWFTDSLLLDIDSPAGIERMHEEILDTRTRIHEGWPADMSKVAFAKKTYGYMVKNTQRLYRAGVPYAVGTDGGGAPRGFNYHVELELLVNDVGLTPMEAIKMATLDGAKTLEVDRHLGSIASGKDASFIVLSANPLDDITNTRQISDVYLKGHKIDREAFKEYWQHKNHFSH